MGLIRYRLDQDTIKEFDNYINDPEKFQILDNNYIVEEPESKRKPLTLEEFIAKYPDIFKTSIDIQRSNN